MYWGEVFVVGATNQPGATTLRRSGAGRYRLNLNNTLHHLESCSLRAIPPRSTFYYQSNVKRAHPSKSLARLALVRPWSRGNIQDWDAGLCSVLTNRP